MTGRVCEVHGEWSATGVCRWCEDPKEERPNFPAGFMPCRCGEYAWELSCSPDMREGVLDGMFHSPAQCFKLDATPPTPDAEPSEKYSLKSVDDLTHQSFIDRTNQAIADLLGPPPDVAQILRTYKPEFLTRIGFAWTEAYIDAETHAAEESRLASEHAALRWERVARRWNYKHCGSWTDVYLDWQRCVDEMAERFRRSFGLPP